MFMGAIEKKRLGKGGEEGWLEDSISRVAGEGLEKKVLEKEKNQRHFMGFFS